MSLQADVVRRQADLIADEALARARGRLQALTREQQRAVDDLAHAVADAVADLLREVCERRPELAAIYRGED